MNKCTECGHKHGSVKCKVKVQRGGRQEECGCTSHSGKFDTGGKFNPGSGKHARMLENMKGNK